VGSGVLREQPVPLSQLIDVVNERFGTDFNRRPISLFFDQIVEAAMGDDGLRRAAAVNPGEKFELLFKNVLERLFVDRMDQNEDIFVRFMNDAPFQKVVTSWMADEAYRRLRTKDVSPQSAARRKLRLVEGAAAERYVKCVPLVPLKAAAGAFGDPQTSPMTSSSGSRWMASVGCGQACSSRRSSGVRWSLALTTALLPLRRPGHGISARTYRARSASRRHRPRDGHRYTLSGTRARRFVSATRGSTLRLP